MTILPFFLFSLMAAAAPICLLAQQNPIVHIPANCPSFGDKTSCLKPKIPFEPFPPWCEWVNGMCRWSEPNIGGHFCPNFQVYCCRRPFCYAESDLCHGTPYDCLNRRTAATCHQVPHCFWYKPGDTSENPDFSVCGREP